MKTILPLIHLGAALLLVSGCATTSHEHPSALPPSAVHSPAANLWIISAVYGSGTQFADVTERVDDMLNQPGTEFFARPEWLHADPTPNWNKALVIVYEYNGRRHIFTAGEGGKVSAHLLAEHAKEARPKNRRSR